MRTNIFFLMALMLVCNAIYAETPDSVRVEIALDTVLPASEDTVESVPYHSLQMGFPSGESVPTYNAPNLRYSNQVRVGNVSIERRNENQRPSAEPNIPFSTPDGRTINSNSKPGAGFNMSWGK